jgi:hypothetical protein
MCASKHATSARPRASKNSDPLSFPPPACPSPHTQLTTDRTFVVASGDAMSIQSSTLKPVAPRSPSWWTVWFIFVRAPASIGPSSPEGSRTTTEPVQVSSVDAAEVDLNEPAPANTRLWVGPDLQGSTSSGAFPPFPQLALFAGSNATAATRS